MNQQTPVGQYTRAAYFYASSTTTNLGPFNKNANDSIMCRLDYSTLVQPPVGAMTESYSVNIGSNPPLAVSSSEYVQSGPYVDFILSGGVEGQQYELNVTITGSTTRTDTITINVPLATCDCDGGPGNSPNVVSYPIGTGTVFINSAVKYTVSTAQPQGANLKDQWYDPNAGILYEFITDGVSSWWQQITPALGASFMTYKLKPITPNGITTQFTLTTTDNKIPNILASTDLIVSVEDVIQNPDVDYRAFGNQIQFTVPPATSSIVFMTWFAHY